MAQPSIAEVIEAVAATRPDQPAVIHRHGVRTWAELLDRTRRLANLLVDAGLGCRTERSLLAGHESGQDHLGIYLYNGPEYLESMIGAWMARVAPFNINYRYTPAELTALFAEARPAVVVVHGSFAATLAEALVAGGQDPLVLQVDDDSGAPLAPGARWLDEALADSAPGRPPVEPSADDLYILFTGGTTGTPKGVLWRNGDALVECFAGIRSATDPQPYVELPGVRSLPAPPFMHGAGHWTALRTLTSGGTVVIPDEPRRFDPADVLATVERHGVEVLLIVGDSFAGPLLAELARLPYDVSSLNVVISGGAPLSAANKQRLTEVLPTAIVLDGLGASEAGGQLTQASTRGNVTDRRGTFAATKGNHVLAADRARRLSPGEREVGWLAKTGLLALGYLGDPARTAETYPTIDGIRYVVPGDRAAYTDDGEIQLFGRESTTINTGGEKVFAEEVEEAVKLHPAVGDCLVVGRPSERWGNEVVAVLTVSGEVSDDELLGPARGQLAGYKLPKELIRVPAVMRSPAGKPDYAWARAVAGTD